MTVDNPKIADKELRSVKRIRTMKKVLINAVLIIGAAFPHDLTFENFVAAWNFPKAFSPDPKNPITMGTFFMNSIICTVSITVLGIIVDSLAAYVLAFKDFPGKRLFIFLALATMMIPFYVTLVNLVLVNTVELLLEKGVTPPVFTSANTDQGDSANKGILETYKSRIRSL